EGLHPVQCGMMPRSRTDPVLGAAAQRPLPAPVTSPPMRFPVRNSATARRSAPLSLEPCGRIAPVMSASTIASGARERSASTAGARESAAPLWQLEQLAANTCAPSGAWANADDAASTTSRTPTAVMKRGDIAAIRYLKSPRYLCATVRSHFSFECGMLGRY